MFVSIPRRIPGKRILLRVDFNEPLRKGKIGDSFRIRSTAPTIHMLAKNGAAIVLISHIEDPVSKKQLSFKKIWPEIARLVGKKIFFVPKIVDVTENLLKKNKIVLLENIRFQKGETENDPNFARRLASVGDLYVNEAFSVSHRNHASIVGIPRYLPSYAGSLFQREVRALREALNPPHPFLLIVGGAKFETKFALMKSFLPRADAIFIGGALANTFLKAHGMEIGRSFFEPTAIPGIKKEFLLSKKIFFPLDAWIGKHKTRDIYSIRKSDMIYDIGPETIAGLADLARISKLIVWNGPLGYIEKGYKKATADLLRTLSRLGVKVILGGGDTLSILDTLRLRHKFYHVSTGGGAMLDFLADGSLPGIDAILKAQARKK